MQLRVQRQFAAYYKLRAAEHGLCTQDYLVARLALVDGLEVPHYIRVPDSLREEVARERRPMPRAG